MNAQLLEQVLEHGRRWRNVDFAFVLLSPPLLEALVEVLPLGFELREKFSIFVVLLHLRPVGFHLGARLVYLGSIEALEALPWVLALTLRLRVLLVRILA